MAEFHFVVDYERHVLKLMEQYPLAEAMDLAVGGGWNTIQKIEVAILRHFGLRDGMRLIDFGCGSGRLAQGLGKSGLEIEYLGLDIVQVLLDYAETITPAHYQFMMNRELSFPVEDNSADIICAFSVFTHLLPEETYVYLEDALRVLRGRGLFILSFLEYTNLSHWVQFQSTVASRKTDTRPHLNTFLARETIDAFAAHLGYTREAFVDGDKAPWGGDALWQSVAVLRKP
jgi:ubiquinone/menaquinone biosynthesis C-methylase UbiE